jgi:ATP-dependent DNA ligase
MSVVYSELRRSIRRAVAFEACLPRKAKEPPSGPDWIHETKHDGFRILAQKDGASVRLVTRNGYDFANRYPLIVDAIMRLPVATCIIDGEAIVVDQNGLSIFDLLRYRKHDHAEPCAPSTSWSSTGRTCDGSRSRSGSSISREHSGHSIMASRSTRPMTATGP